MLLAIPEGSSRLRGYDLGDFGFPWLAVADVVIAAAHQGWSYWRTRQQIRQTMSMSATDIASATDIDAVSAKVAQNLGIDPNDPELKRQVTNLVSGDPTKAQEVSPMSLLERRIYALETQPQPPSGMPTWGWIALAIGGVLLLKPDLLGLGKGRPD